MELRDWITLVIVPSLSVLAAGIASVWLWLTKSYIPAQQKRQEELIQAALAEKEDTREFRQQNEASSLNVLIANQDMLIKAVLQYTDKDLKEILYEIRAIRGEMQKLVGNSSIQTREWSKIEEVLSDIDLMYHRIEGILQGVLIERGNDD